MSLSYRDRGTSSQQLDVVSRDVVVCFLYKAVLTSLAGQPTRWDWIWRLEHGPQGWHKHGSAPTMEVAQKLIDAQWRAWPEAAGLAER